MNYKLVKTKFAMLNIDADLSQVGIARETGWKREYVNQAIRHGREVPEKVAKRWSDLMGVPLDELFEEIKEPVEVTE